MKKKTIKKAGAAVLTMAMLLSMGAMTLPVYATTALTSSSITLSGAPGTYKVYQVATAAIDAQGTVTYTVTDTFKDVIGTSKGDYDLTFKTSDADAPVAYGTKINTTTMTSNNSEIEYVANQLAKKVIASTEAKGTFDIVSDAMAVDITEAGYYLILGVTNGYTQPILVNMVPEGNTTTVTKGIKVKNSEVTFSKKIKEIDALHAEDNKISTDKTTGIVDKGATVTYVLETQIPRYDSDVQSLANKFTITDIPEDSLTIKEDSIKVKVGGTDVNATTEGNKTYTVTKGITENSLSKYYKEVVAGTNTDFVTGVDTTGNGFQIVFDDTYVLNEANAGKTVKVEFDAIVNDNFDVNEDSNDNGATLSYSNNYFTGSGKVNYPDNPGPGEPTTPEENPPREEFPEDGNPPEPKVIPGLAKVYCTTETVEKVDENDAPVEGATFKLYAGDLDTVIDSTTGKPKAELLVAAPAATAKNGKNNIFTFSGLGEGTYTMVETAPADYTGVAPFEIVIKAVDANASGDIIAYDGHFTYTRSDSNDVPQSTTNATKVVNVHKKTLPATGGIGSIIFTVTGAAIIVLACVLFVIYMKKRKTWEE